MFHDECCCPKLALKLEKAVVPSHPTDSLIWRLGQWEHLPSKPNERNQAQTITSVWSNNKTAASGVHLLYAVKSGPAFGQFLFIYLFIFACMYLYTYFNPSHICKNLITQVAGGWDWDNNFLSEKKTKTQHNFWSMTCLYNCLVTIQWKKNFKSTKSWKDSSSTVTCQLVIMLDGLREIALPLILFVLKQWEVAFLQQ